MRQRKWTFALTGIFLAVGILGSFLMLQKPHTSMVEIVQDGQVLYRLNLAQELDHVLEIEYDGRITRGMKLAG